MSKPTLSSLDSRITKLETEVHIQFKEIFYRLKRLEVFLVGGMGAVITMLVSILMRMS
jgi:hypothetical protein|tara:strand:+ start:11336 stop:11509 length:174 start_codon:yes stop_codon:yes gene_type:complete